MDNNYEMQYLKLLDIQSPEVCNPFSTLQWLDCEITY